MTSRAIFVASAALMSAMMQVGSLWAESSTAISPAITVDTRNVLTGTLTGYVSGSGKALSNAQVSVENTLSATNTFPYGYFALANVPVGNGYVVNVGAPGFVSARLVGVNVPAAFTNLGTITLTPSTGQYTLLPLVPDVNPSITTVEEGGTAYRYYRIASSPSNHEGGVSISVQILNGNTIVQTNDISGYWPGRVAGVSDARDGVARVAVPSSALGTAGTAQQVQVSVSGQVQQTFQAQVVSSAYDQVWKHKLGGGIGAGELLTVEADASAESQIRRTLTSGALTAESISRQQETKISIGGGGGLDIGLSLSTPSVSWDGTVGGSAGVGAFVEVMLDSTYTFDPNSTAPLQNAMKLYVDLGNMIANGSGLERGFYNNVENTIEPTFLGSNLASVEGDIEVGDYVQGQLGAIQFVSSGGQPAQIGFGGSGSANVASVLGIGRNYGTANESASEVGVVASETALVGAGGYFPTGGSQNLMSTNFYYRWGTSHDVEFIQKNWTQQGQSNPYRTEVIQKVTYPAGEQMPTGAWQLYDPQSIYANYQREFTSEINKFGANMPASYEWMVLAEQQNLGFSFNLDLGIGISLQGELDQGAEVFNERGSILQGRNWPTESYPAVTTAQLPTQSWTSILSQWGYYASGPIGQAVNQITTSIGNGVNTVFSVGKASVNIAGGALASGAHVVSSWVSDLVPGTKSPNSLTYHALGLGLVPAPNYLPPDGASNYVYGIGGIYRFASSNTFSGTATLSIAYSDADVAGLNPPDLRIYQLPDGSNYWQLVGGTVDTVSNTVTATITNLGMFAVAPPMPTGNLLLIPSTNALPADGVSQMSVVVSNLMLNTGSVATQQWLFTATATGVQILNANADTNMPGVQVVSDTNGVVTLLLQAPTGGTVAKVSLTSVVGDASGTVEINLIDNTPPATPTGILVSAGQSRVFVSWITNSEPDLASYRVYYRAGQDGPPYNGTAMMEGTASPVQVTGTNCLLRGLSLGTNYYVSVSAVDTSGNESPLSSAISVTTVPSAPSPPTSVAWQYGNNGTNIVMWALSEDDGYNDRDVVRYDILRAVLPGSTYTTVGQVNAGVSLYMEPSFYLASTQSLSYAVVAIASNGTGSTQGIATGILGDSVGDGIPDSWRAQFFASVDPTGATTNYLSCATCDPDGDGMNNMQEYLAGTDPTNPNSALQITAIKRVGADMQVFFKSVGGKYYSLARRNLVGGAWMDIVTNIPGNGGIQWVKDIGGAAFGTAFYRIELSPATNSPSTDSDGDGIPDFWMQKYFGHPTGLAIDGSCATCDLDGTGQGNLFKYLAGLDPTNPESVFVLSIGNVNGQPNQKSLMLGPVALARSYTTEFTTDLVNGTWSPLMACGCPQTNGNQLTITDLDATQPEKFYRIEISTNMPQSLVCCSFSISPSNTSFGYYGGSNSLSVIATATNCPWTSSSNSSWITIYTNSMGRGSKSLGYSVAGNTSTAGRTGTITVAGILFTIVQQSGDTIGDGIPNWWRALYFPNQPSGNSSGSHTNAVSCATCDANGTGQNNFFKYIAGLDPTNPASVFVVNISNTNQPSQNSLIFLPLKLGRTYTPQFSTNLAGGTWLPLATYIGPRTNNGNQVSITDTNPIPPQEFYRIDITYP